MMPEIPGDAVFLMIAKHIEQQGACLGHPIQLYQAQGPVYLEHRFIRIEPDRPTKLGFRQLECFSSEEIDTHLVAVVAQVMAGPQDLLSDKPRVTASRATFGAFLGCHGVPLLSEWHEPR